MIGIDRVLLCAAMIVLALPAAAEQTGIVIANPWARATPGGATVGAAYLEIKAAEGAADRLTGAESPAAGRVEIHTHVSEDGVMKMRKVETLDITAGATRALAPMGDHLMLMDLKGPLKEGDRVVLTLVFEKAGRVYVDAPVLSIGAMGPNGKAGSAAGSGSGSGSGSGAGSGSGSGSGSGQGP